MFNDKQVFDQRSLRANNDVPGSNISDEGQPS
jgi:hypothetical protein